jgi:hypothetical protein
MPTNPFTDVWHFLTATTNDYLHQGNWRYLILALFPDRRSSKTVRPKRLRCVRG